MKHFKIIFLLFATLLVHGCAVTTIITKSTPVDSVVNVDNISKDVLFVRANNWMVDAFKNAKSVIQFTDKDSGSISGRYLLGNISAASQFGPASDAYATIKIRVKDGAAKISITPESFGYPEGNMYKNYIFYTQEDVTRDVSALITSFERAMKKPEDNNW